MKIDIEQCECDAKPGEKIIVKEFQIQPELGYLEAQGPEGVDGELLLGLGGRSSLENILFFDGSRLYQRYYS